MSKTVDVLIIGVGVIGTATAFELSKFGYKTLSINSNGEAGHGSTSGSCGGCHIKMGAFVSARL